MYLMFLTLCLPLALTMPTGERQVSPFGPQVQIQYGTVVGTNGGLVHDFKGIPFAQPPTGSLRLKPPQPIVSHLGTIDATGVPLACPQFFLSTNSSSLPEQTLAQLLGNAALQGATESGEDCLTLNVQRPYTATAGSNLPVLFWIFGGGFEFGSTQNYDATELITASIMNNQEIIFVAVNYRLGGFGFLPGKEIKADGAANLGLLDQRLALQWVADNIYNFGGDPSKVTIWGESAGSISVFDQMALYNGSNKYKGNPLFRAAIMDSGSIISADPVDCQKSQVVYATVVKNAGCSLAADTLACLRSLDYETYLNAANSVPALFSYQSIALAYLSRPDGVTLVSSPDLHVETGQYAKVPMIIGGQEDEGTLFALSQSNISTTDQIVQYFQEYFYHQATLEQIQTLVSLYPDDPSAGSPFRTGAANNIYPQYKRLAAMLGDLTFNLTRRIFLTIASIGAPSVPSWSYLASYEYNLVPVLGTYHTSDISTVFGMGIGGLPSPSIQAYYLNFINKLNPNSGTSGETYWPQWSQGNMLMNFNVANNVLIPDNFRQTACSYIEEMITSLYY